MTRVAAIVQARMGSTRFPCKMLADLCGYPVFQWVIERCKRAGSLTEVVIATTTSPADDDLASLARKFGVMVFRGSEEDVLGRFIETAETFNLDVVVRVCADNPLVAPEEIDRLVHFYLRHLPAYAFNHIPRWGNNYPDGLGAEILSAVLLKQIGQSSLVQKHREHVTSYLWEHAYSFDMQTFPCPAPYNQPEMKLDIDTPEDLSFMAEVCETLSFTSSPEEILNR